MNVKVELFFTFMRPLTPLSIPVGWVRGGQNWEKYMFAVKCISDKLNWIKVVFFVVVFLN